MTHEENPGRLTPDDIINLQDPEKMLEKLSSLSKEEKQQPSIAMLLSKINFLKGNFVISAEGYRFVTTLDPQNVLAFYELGICEYYKGNLEGALAAFRTVLAGDPHFHMAEYWSGRCYRDQLRHAEVIGLFSKLFQQFPEWAGIACDLAEALAATGQVDEAIQTLEKAVKRAKKNVMVHYHLGNYYHRQGQWEKAMAAYKAGLKVDPTNPLLGKALEMMTDVDAP